LRSNSFLRLRVGFILASLTFGCFVFFILCSPLLFSEVRTYLDSGCSFFFPSLLTKLGSLPLTLGQFLDHCILVVLLWFVLSSFFPFIQKFRALLKYDPEEEFFALMKETEKNKHSSILGEVTGWDNISEIGRAHV